MGTLDTLPSILQSARALYPSLPIHVHPSSIGLRFNSWGVESSVWENKEAGRVAMTGSDIRDQGRFGAAWAAGFFSSICSAQEENLPASIALGSVFMDPSKAALSLQNRPEAAAVALAVAAARGSQLLPVQGLREGLRGMAWRTESR